MEDFFTIGPDFKLSKFPSLVAHVNEVYTVVLYNSVTGESARTCSHAIHAMQKMFSSRS